MEIKEVGRYLAVFLAFAFLLFLLVYSRGKLTGFVVFEQPGGSGGDFDLGTYNNTIRNGSAVILSSGQTTGIYTSKIFNATNDAVWNNISWISGFDYYQEELPDNKAIETAKGGADMTQNVLLLHMNNNWNDGSGEGNHGTAYNGATFTTSSKLGSHAGSFDGTNDYVNCGNAASLNIRNKITISAWIKPDTLSTSNQNSIVAKSQSYWFFVSTTKKLTFLRFNANDPDTGYGRFSSISTDEDISTGTWIFVAATYDTSASNQVKLYINGQLKKSTNFANGPIDISTNPVDIGRWQTQHYFDGTIDEISVWNRTLSGSEIANIYKRGALKLNLTARSCDDNACSGESWTDITDESPQNLFLNNNRYFQYKFDFSTDNPAFSPALYNVSIDYTLLNVAPTITLVSPQDGASYGYNKSLALNFIASDADNNIDSCWYVLNSGNNIISGGCANTTIDVPEGSNTLVIYVNDTQGEQASDSSTFSVSVGAPSITLNSPINSYLTNYDVTFRYVPTDIDLKSCELWGDFTGTFMLNQTDTNPTSGSENTFVLTLPDGIYKWNIRCNDSIGNSATSGNKTFYIDTINPSLSITEPTGTKKTRTGIPLIFSVIDSSPNYCQYNVQWITGGIVKENTTIANCASTAFDVAADGNYVLNLYANDSAGNKNSSSSNFSVDTSVQPSQPSPSGGGGASVPTNKSQFFVSISGLENVVMRPGESKTLSLEVRNTGKLMQNNCKIVRSDWISSIDEKDLNANEKADFVFSVRVPKDAEIGDYNIDVDLKCQDGEKAVSLKVSVLGTDFDISIKEISEIKGNKISFIYAVRELSGKDSEISISFAIVDFQGKKIAETSNVISLAAGEEKELKGEIEVPKGTIGEYNLIVGGESRGVYVKDSSSILITGRGVLGFTGFLESEQTKKYISIGILILIAGVVGFFIIRRIISIRGKKEERKGVIRIGRREQ